MDIKCVVCSIFVGVFVYFQSYGQDEPVIFEAESGTLGADYNTDEDGGITYITSATDFANTDFPAQADKVNTYEVTFPEAGTYDLFARIRVGANGADDDSFFYGNGFGEQTVDNADEWIRVNNLSAVGFTVDDDVVGGAGVAQNNVWKWINLSEFEGDEAAITFTVNEGDLTQTFQIGGREDGLDFDKFAFGKSDLYYTVANLDNGEAGSAEPPDSGTTMDPIAKGQSKFLGNVYSSSQAPGFTNYWNQVTPENAGKWGSVEGTRDQYNWSGLDAAYQLAKDNGFPFKLHVLIWGAQQPEWIETLPAAEQLEEIKEWMDTVSARYPDIDIVEVVNEPLHDPPDADDDGGGNYIDALGGSGSSGWDWVIKSFDLARTYFPNATLMINDYNIVNSSANTSDYKEIIELLQADDLVDGIGVQAHAFSVNTAQASTITSNLDQLASTGLPIYVTELDIDGPTDLTQVERYRRIFPAFWEHSSMQGVTLWGYRPGMWRTDEMAYLIDSEENERPALAWLRAYVEGNLVYVSSIEVNSDPDSVIVNGTLQMEATINPSDPTIPDVEWSVDPESRATIDENGMLTAKSAGTVNVIATAKDGTGATGSMTIKIYGEEITGLEETEHNFVLYPNPLNDKSFIVKGKEGIQRIKIFDLNGYEVKEWEADNNQIASVKIDMDVSPGIYAVRIFSGNDYSIKKLLVR